MSLSQSARSLQLVMGKDFFPGEHPDIHRDNSPPRSRRLERCNDTGKRLPSNVVATYNLTPLEILIAAEEMAIGENLTLEDVHRAY